VSRTTAGPSICVEVRFFAVLRERAGAERRSVRLPAGATVADLKERLRELIPALPGGAAVAIDLEYAPPERVLDDGDEVALIPPVSGG
jgi:molybdopterin converting factor subunit 1